MLITKKKRQEAYNESTMERKRGQRKAKGGAVKNLKALSDVQLHNSSRGLKKRFTTTKLVPEQYNAQGHKGMLSSLEPSFVTRLANKVSTKHSLVLVTN